MFKNETCYDSILQKAAAQLTFKLTLHLVLEPIHSVRTRSPWQLQLHDCLYQKQQCFHYLSSAFSLQWDGLTYNDTNGFKYETKHTIRASQATKITENTMEWIHALVWLLRTIALVLNLTTWCMVYLVLECSVEELLQIYIGSYVLSSASNVAQWTSESYVPITKSAF